MYDLDSSDHDSGGQYGAPSRLLTALEFPRFLGEYTTTRVLHLLPNAPRPDAVVRPVLVIPGFSANDRMTRRLRTHLRRQGHVAHGWRLGRNIGILDWIAEGLLERLEELRIRHGHPVSLVGWSFGGMWARWLAHQRPDAVRNVITLATPWRPTGEHTRATAMFERSRRQHGISDRALDIVNELRQPLPVPLVAIWSRTDGIVPWQGCVVDEVAEPVPSENLEVLSSHVGMVSSPLVLAAITDRLAQDVEDWRPFDWRRVLADNWHRPAERAVA